jgi:pyruvate dehydrogenase E1 component
MWQGLKDMVVDLRNRFYYITMMNENYPHPPMPEGCEAGIIAGMYRLKGSDKPNHQSKTAAKKIMHVQLLGAGSILREVEAAMVLLEQDFGITADVWSVPSVDEVYRDAMDVQRFNRLNVEHKPKISYLEKQLNETVGPIIIATDYVRLHTEKLRQFMPRRYETLGTDGYGRSDSREALRRHFEVDRYSVVVTALYALVQDGHLKSSVVTDAMKRYNMKGTKPNPLWA